VISVGSLLNFCLKASLRLCAGSVEMIRTLVRTAATWIARLHAVVVFPTPPCVRGNPAGLHQTAAGQANAPGLRTTGRRGYLRASLLCNRQSCLMRASEQAGEDLPGQWRGKGGGGRWAVRVVRRTLPPTKIHRYWSWRRLFSVGSGHSSSMLCLLMLIRCQRQRPTGDICFPINVNRGHRRIREHLWLLMPLNR